MSLNFKIFKCLAELTLTFTLKGEPTQTESEHVLWAISKLFNTFLEHNMTILKQNKQNIVLINNLKTVYPTKIGMQ